MELYREEILDHSKNPRNFGKLNNPDREFREFNPLCGDEVEIGVKFEDSTLRVEDVKFQGKGCAISIASASMLTEKVKGRTLPDLEKLTEDEVLSWFGGNLTSSRRDCALLPLKTLREALVVRQAHYSEPGRGGGGED